MNDLLILGTGVHAAEMVEIVERVNRVEKRWRLRGLIAADERKVGLSFNGVPVVGSKERLAEYTHADLVPDSEWPRTIAVTREQLVSLIDPSVFVSRTARIGLGCVLYPNCYVGLNARIGDYVFCLSGCTINHDSRIEDGVTMASGVILAGSVHVEAECYLGQGSTVRQCLRIGRGSLLGMGCVAVKDVPPNSVMVGNPARRLRDRRKEA